jgi:hypothetical protein
MNMNLKILKEMHYQLEAAASNTLCMRDQFRREMPDETELQLRLRDAGGALFTAADAVELLIKKLEQGGGK